MKLSAQLDVTMVAHETDDEVTLLLELTAPAAPAQTEQRAPSSLQVVLDRSGSMAGPPLAGALRALEDLVARLDAHDNVGLVAFDHQAHVVAPAGPLTDKQDLVHRIRAIHPGGSTDLSSGYLRGLQELKRVKGESGGTLVVVSDGHANAGLTDRHRFADIAAAAHRDGIVTSTLGYGLGYDETLLTALARSGSGNHHFAEDPDAAGAAIASEVDNLLTKTAQAASLTVRVYPQVELLQLYNDLPAEQLTDSAVMIELGDFYADESRRLLLRLRVPAMGALGLARVATLRLRYVELPSYVEHTVSLPVTVNVVPGDEAKGQLADPVVRSEQLFQEAQLAKKESSEAMRERDLDKLRRSISASKRALRRAQQVAPEDLQDELVGELDEVESLGREAEIDPNRASKLSSESFHRQSRKRGRPSDRRSGPSRPSGPDRPE
jgi:Ca-activated chloride channel homolog